MSATRHQAIERLPLGPGQPGRGDAAPRPRRRARRDDAHVPRLGRRRRIQRGPRPEALLRPALGGGHRAGRQPGRPPRRGPDVPGRRRSDRALGQGRRRRAHGAERAELHRARVRRAGGARVLGPRPHGHLAAEARRHRLGHDLRQGRRALVPHRRHLRGALRDDAAGGEGGHGGRAASRRHRSPTTSTTGRRCGSPSAARSAPARSIASWRPTST